MKHRFETTLSHELMMIDSKRWMQEAHGVVFSLPIHTYVNILIEHFNLFLSRAGLQLGGLFVLPA